MISALPPRTDIENQAAASARSRSAETRRLPISDTFAKTPLIALYRAAQRQPASGRRVILDQEDLEPAHAENGFKADWPHSFLHAPAHLGVTDVGLPISSAASDRWADTPNPHGFGMHSKATAAEFAADTR